MSEQETIIGKIKLLPRLENEPDEKYFERVCGKTYKVYDSVENILDAIDCNNLYKEYIVLKGQIYKFIEYKESYHEFCNVTPLEDGSIEFVTSFYNGGTCLEEMLESKM